MSDTLQAYVKTKEAANFLGLSKATLESWRTRGGGPVYHKFKGAVRYKQDELEEYAEAGARRSTSDQPARA
ncbi:MAG: helix-turn-helix domain-containing protein [Candidatus Sumerlaeota bacterium]|nr:helix-turn-helix domain-containing protein [Candidatus Sumerlaeota bacterium]